RPWVAPKLDGRAVPVMSLTSGAGFDDVRSLLSLRVRALADAGPAPVLTRARHRHAIETCVGALARARAAGAIELAAEDVRMAARAVGRITGRVDVEDLLDVIFSEFCIGK